MQKQQKPHLRRTALWTAFVLAGLVTAPTAHAQAEPPSVNIAAQPLGAALDALAAQAKIKLLYSPEAVKGKTAPALTGRHAPEAALSRLLAGSGLIYVLSDGAYAIKPAPLSKYTKEEEVSPRGKTVAQIAQETHKMPEIVITATRTERRADEVPASVSVLTEKSLATKSRQNINDALRDFESLDFVSQQGVGHQVFPTIRGVGGSFAGSTTQVLVDGMAHDSVVSGVMGHGGLNFTSLLDVERVEVVRGPASALYGPSAVGGVINVIPKRWKGAPGAEVLASYGTHNTQTLGAAVGVAKDSFDIRLSVYDAKSDGYKAAPVEDQYGEWDLGPRDWKDNKIGLMMGFRPANNHEVTFDFQQYKTRSATYGGRPNARQDMDGQSATLSYRYDLSAETNIKANFRTTKLKQKYYFDSWDWNGLTTPGTVAAADLDLAYYGGRDSDSTAFQAILDTRPMAGNQLIVGYGHDTGDYESYGADVGGATTVNGSKSKVDAVLVQDEHKFGAITLTAGARYDRIDLSPETVDGVPKNGGGSVANVTNPRLGARYHLTEVTSFYASYGTAYLPATNSFKYVQPTTTRVDNPSLKPETSTTYEIGMNNTWYSGSLRTALFHTDYEDKINLGTDAATGKRQWQNVAVVKVDGIEMAYQGDLGHGWKPYANFSYTKARDYATPGAPGTQSLRVAPRKFNAGLTYAPGDAWSATINARYVSGLYFNNLTQAQWADGYTQVDAKVSAKLPVQGQKLEAFLAVNNLTDKKYEAFNKTERTDGRTVTVGLNGRF